VEVQAGAAKEKSKLKLEDVTMVYQKVADQMVQIGKLATNASKLLFITSYLIIQ
jgi:hypothetical protein